MEEIVIQPLSSGESSKDKGSCWNNVLSFILAFLCILLVCLFLGLIVSVAVLNYYNSRNCLILDEKILNNATNDTIVELELFISYEDKTFWTKKNATVDRFIIGKKYRCKVVKDKVYWSPNNQDSVGAVITLSVFIVCTICSLLTIIIGYLCYSIIKGRRLKRKTSQENYNSFHDEF